LSAPAVANAAPRPRGRLLSLSIDLDNQWSYMKTHGDSGWESFPSYMDALADVALERFARLSLTLTAFVVGQDAALPCNRGALRAIAEAGHEIGNHSFRHEPWMHLYPAAELEREVASAHEQIEAATRRRPRGFRGPGFAFSPELLRVLARHGYVYDASTYPTFLGPLMRAYYFWKSPRFSREEKRRRSRLFGSWSDGLRPLRPYLWQLDGRELVEIPVTTMPLARAPIHMSYLLYIASLGGAGSSLLYLRAALELCARTGVEPSFLLHPLDFLGGDRVSALAFFPGMGLATSFKLELFERVVALLRGRFEIVTLGQHAARVLADPHPRRHAVEPAGAAAAGDGGALRPRG
jgi:hypothetical protein